MATSLSHFLPSFREALPAGCICLWLFKTAKVTIKLFSKSEMQSTEWSKQNKNTSIHLDSTCGNAFGPFGCKFMQYEMPRCNEPFLSDHVIVSETVRLILLI